MEVERRAVDNGETPGEMLFMYNGSTICCTVAALGVLCCFALLFV